MEIFRCKNERCNPKGKPPVLFEGKFVGTIKKICPKCKMMNTFIGKNAAIEEKICNINKNT